MRNLAGDPDCDHEIRRELTRARIDIVEGERSTREVAASLTGKLGAFTFSRAWRYWVVSGPMPVEEARKLYADPVGCTDVRVNGHCGCPSPDEGPWATHYDAAGKRLESDRGGEELQLQAHFLKMGFITQEQCDKYRLVPDPKAAAATSFVEVYHIDSEVGLRLFADAVRGLTR